MHNCAGIRSPKIWDFFLSLRFPSSEIIQGVLLRQDLEDVFRRTTAFVVF